MKSGAIDQAELCPVFCGNKAGRPVKYRWNGGGTNGKQWRRAEMQVNVTNVGITRYQWYRGATRAL